MKTVVQCLEMDHVNMVMFIKRTLMKIHAEAFQKHLVYHLHSKLIIKIKLVHSGLAGSIPKDVEAQLLHILKMDQISGYKNHVIKIDKHFSLFH